MGESPSFQKKGGKYRLFDFPERGDNDGLGLKARFGLSQVPLIDILHRLLWLVEHRTPAVGEFVTGVIQESDKEKLKLVAQVLAGSGLQGGIRITTEAETGTLQKLVSNWGMLVDTAESKEKQRSPSI